MKVEENKDGTFDIELTKEEELLFLEKAKEEGLSVEDFMIEVIRKGVEKEGSV